MKNEGLTVVFTPSLAAIKNLTGYLQSLNIQAVSINSTTSIADRDAIKSNITQPNSLIRFFVITPEIFSEYGNYGNGQWFRDLIVNGNINYIVVDEAHKIIDAVEYRTAFKDLIEFRSLNLNIPWIALTSINQTLETNITESLGMQDPLSLWSSSVRKNIFYETCSNSSYEGESVLSFINRMNQDDEMPCGIIFCKTYSHLYITVEYLNAKGCSVVEYYGRMAQRQDILERWSNREFSILVATSESFGFGIHYDLPLVKFVIHIGMPANLRSFYHVS